MRPISKITRAKWTGCVAQAVEHLLCKHKVLSSKHIRTKKRQEFIFWITLLIVCIIVIIKVVIMALSLSVLFRLNNSAIILSGKLGKEVEV
jgi:heme/copper-type cytochrome/quinol oxidase subunit 2